MVRKEDGEFNRPYFNVKALLPASARSFTPYAGRESTSLPKAYRFSVTSDDGARLYIDDQLVINQWQNSPSTTTNYDLDLTAGPHDLNGILPIQGPAQARLNWGFSTLPVRRRAG